MSAAFTPKDLVTTARTSASVIPNRASRNALTSYLGRSSAFAGNVAASKSKSTTGPARRAHAAAAH